MKHFYSKLWFKNNKVESLKHQIIILSFERKHLIYKKEKYFTNSSRICLFTCSLLKKITFTRNDEWIYFRPWIYFLLKHLPTKSYCVQFWTKRIYNSIHLSKSSFFSKLFICFIVLCFFPKYSCFIVKYLKDLFYSCNWWEIIILAFYNYFLVNFIIM